MAGLGIGRTFQNVALFRRLSVRDNILVGAHHLGHSGFFANAFRVPVVRREEAVAAGRLDDLLDLLDLRVVEGIDAGSLPFGTQKRVELARGLIGGPKLPMLDEPAGGLNHGEVDDLAELLQLTLELPFLIVGAWGRLIRLPQRPAPADARAAGSLQTASEGLPEAT